MSGGLVRKSQPLRVNLREWPKMKVDRDYHASQVVRAAGERGGLEGRGDLVGRGPVIRQSALYQERLGQLVLGTA